MESAESRPKAELPPAVPRIRAVFSARTMEKSPHIWYDIPTLQQAW